MRLGYFPTQSMPRLFLSLFKGFSFPDLYAVLACVLDDRKVVMLKTASIAIERSEPPRRAALTALGVCAWPIRSKSLVNFDKSKNAKFAVREFI